ncbi:O-antigen ligase family protein [Candidatus Woesebacteria bacterium]|nr:O-antigen ligase family protein [Candidatus Woesebacteria bacterium]
MVYVLLQILLLGLFVVVGPGLQEYFELPKVLFFFLVLPIMAYATLLNEEKSIPRNKKLNSLGLRTLRSSLSQIWTKPQGVLLLFILWAGVSSYLGGKEYSLWGQPLRYQGIVFFLYGLLCTEVVKRISWQPKYLNALKRSVSIGAAVNVFVLLVQFILFNNGVPVIQFYGRMTGLIGNPNFAGGALALSFPYLFFQLKQKPVLLLIALILWSLALYTTDSRGAVAAYAVVVLLLVGRFFKRKYTLMLLGTVAVALLLFFPKRIPSVFDSRPIIWQKAVQAAQEKPLFGWGLENFTTAFQSTLLPEGDFDLHQLRVDKAHNEFLEMLVTTGMVGCLVYTTVFLRSLYIFWHRRSDDFAYLQFVVLIAFGMLAQVNVLNITEYIFFFIAIGLAQATQEVAKARGSTVE